VLKNGINFGETHTAVVSVENGVALLSHPIDVQFECNVLDGWPLFICEVSSISHSDFYFYACWNFLIFHILFFVGMGQIIGPGKMFQRMWERMATLSTKWDPMLGCGALEALPKGILYPRRFYC
jgi:hypothetical protein